MAPPKKHRKSPELAGDGPRRDLLVAAYELIAHKGFEGLRTRDIVARARVNISTLHYHFGTKEALLEAVVLFVAQKFAGEGGALARTPPDPTVRGHFERTLATFRRNPELAIVLQELALRAQRDAATRKAFRPILAYWNLTVTESVRAEVRAGTLPPGADPEELALVITSFIIGAITQQGVNPKALDFEVLSRRFSQLIADNRR
jgi:AcrR family transcriptional regulator